jgi:hypothetical protein
MARVEMTPKNWAAILSCYVLLLIAGGIVLGLVTGKLKPGSRKRNDFGSDIGSNLSSFD